MARRGKLSDVFAKAAKRGFHRDGLIPGFGLRVGARNRAWELRVERKGRPKHFLTLGHYPTMSAAKARAEAHESLAKYEKREPLRAKPGEPTLETMLPLYLERLEDDNASPSTHKWYKECIARLSEDLRHTPLRELGLQPILLADDIARFRRRLRDKSPRGGQSAASSTARAVKTLFRFAQRRDPTLIGDPTSAVKKVDPKRDQRVLGASELPGWWADVEKIPNEVKRSALAFCLLSGLRRSNLVAIEWSMLDLKRRCVRIPKTKRGTPFDLILSRPMVRVLQQARDVGRKIYREHAERYVFPGPLGHMRGDALNRDGVAANHALRRSFATLARESGVPKDVIAVLLGHGESDVTDRYIRSSRLGALYTAAMADISRHIVRCLGSPTMLK